MADLVNAARKGVALISASSIAELDVECDLAEGKDKFTE